MPTSKNLEVFKSAPVPKAVLSGAFPAMAAMLMVLIYNLADTFFIGQTNDALLVAAVSLATPIFLIFMAIGTIFGIGGTSVISRAMGEGRHDFAKKVSAFCMGACIVVGLLLSACFLIFMDDILRLVGASDETIGPAREYLTIVAYSGPFVLIANCYNNIIRAEGKSNTAAMGQVIGNLLNIILDPIMIFPMGLGIKGAAIATVIGNVVAALFYISYFCLGRSMLSISPRDFSLRDGIPRQVLSIGIPAALGSLLMSLSSIIVNSLMSGYGDMAIAGIGVAMKVTMITGMICIGFGQGVQPILGYCVGANLWDRFRKIMHFSLIFSFVLSAVMTIICFLFTPEIVSVFLSEKEAYDYALSFSRIMLTTSFIFGIFYVLANTIQAMGAATEALIINLSRQGLIYIPALFILPHFMGVYGLAWAQPVADVLSTVMVVILYKRTYTRMRRKAK